ncbi:hypothetical protein L195_g015046, partial [Trifolium pratense]
MAAADVKDA